ncbi:MAG: alpha/beta fold hydrolase [Actinomycetota bacterium]
MNYIEDTDIPTEKVSWHSNEIVFRRCGDGPAVILLHGIAGSFDTWNGVLPALGKKCYAVAPDLLGHGRSAKPRGDYSLGAYATGVRDLMEALEIPSATIVGHSLGGGIAMQFAYQFPERCQRLVLVDSGGLGPEVTPFLRAATLPGASLVVSAITSERARRTGRSLWRRLQRAGVGYRRSATSVAHHLFSLDDAAARKAFVATARSVMDWRGQRIDATDRLYLAGHVPTLIAWGRRDRFIPVRHGAAAHDLIPGSRFEVFEEAGHFPHEEEPERFSELLLEFIESTAPAEISVELLRSYAMRDEPTIWESPAP